MSSITILHEYCTKQTEQTYGFTTVIYFNELYIAILQHKKDIHFQKSLKLETLSTKEDNSKNFKKLFKKNI